MTTKAEETRLGNELPDDLAALIGKILMDTLGIATNTAEAVGEQAAVDLSDKWGGAMVYIPAGRIAKALLMRKKLYQMHKEGGCRASWAWLLFRWKTPTTATS